MVPVRENKEMKEWIEKIKREVQPPSPIGVSNRVILKLIAEIERLEKENEEQFKKLIRYANIIRELENIKELMKEIDLGHIILMMGTFDNFASKIQVEKLKALQQALAESEEKG